MLMKINALTIVAYEHNDHLNFKPETLLENMVKSLHFCSDIQTLNASLLLFQTILLKYTLNCMFSSAKH